MLLLIHEVDLEMFSQNVNVTNQTQGTPEYPGVYARIADQVSIDVVTILASDLMLIIKIAQTIIPFIVQFTWIKDTVCAGYPNDALCDVTSSPTKSPAPTAAPTPCDGVDVEFSINTDNFSHEIFYYVRDVQTNQIHGVGGDPLGLPTFEDNTDYKADVCLADYSESTCYTFYIEDEEGDGIDNSDRTNNGYCINVDGEDVECNYNFNGVSEQVYFPKDSCDICNPSPVTIDLQTAWFGDNFIIIVDGENTIAPHATIDGSALESSNYEDAFVTNICRNLCYTVTGQNLDSSTTFNLYLAGQLVATERDVANGNVHTFCGDGLPNSAFGRSVMLTGLLSAVAGFVLLF